jgi:glucuronokinase
MTNRIATTAYPRVGLAGNPTDALGGAAIALTFRDFEARALLQPAERITLLEPERELPSWTSVEDLQRYITVYGYYGGRRLMMALIARLGRYCREQSIDIPCRNFSLRWESTIPLRVGLAGSSAILTAALRAILTFWNLDIPKLDQVDLVMNTERVDLGIPAGPLDRVGQVFEGLVYFEPGEDLRLRVEPLDSTALPPLFVAVDESSSEGTEIFHSNLRGRFERGEPAVIEGLTRQTELAQRVRDLLKARRGSEIGPLMDENFEIRRQLTRLNPRHEAMVETARAAGAHAKFSGSGGAIVGTCAPERMAAVLDALQAAGYRAFQPSIQDPRPL